MRYAISFSVITAASLLASSAAAQQRPQDFTLPEPTPTSTPAPQGPVDDTGVIPVGPRVIPTDTPTPVPTQAPPQPVPTASATPVPVRTPVPTPTRTVPAPTQRPAASTQPTLTPTVPSSDPASDPIAAPAETTITPPATGDGASGLPALPSQAPVTDTANTGEASPASDLPWAYILGALAALIALLGGFLFWKRRQDNAPPPTIKRPVVDAALDHVAATAIPPRFEMSFEIEGITRSLMAVMVTGRLVIKNLGERAIRDVALSAELSSAHHPSAKTDGNLTPIGEFERIGPHQAQRHKIDLKLPLDQVAGMRRDGVPFFVPLLRLQANASGADPKRLDLVLGTVPPGTGHKLQPLRLDGPPGAYDHLRGHPLNTREPEPA